MDVWLSSDHHFFHKNILKYCPDTRAGDTVDEMNQMMVEAHNAVVKPKDEVWFLGDFSFGNVDQTMAILDQLNGKINLVYGNHDLLIQKNAMLQSRFASTQAYKCIKCNGHRIALFHFPIIRFDQCHRGAMHCYGHTHGTYQHPGRAMDVGVDTRSDLKPYNIDEVITLLQSRPC